MYEIQQTEDYSSFKRIKGNRTLNKAQVAKLSTSLGEHPELAAAIPVIVNDKMEIIDGQHRFQALKRLGLPVYYLILNGLDLSAVQILNSSTKIWTPMDFAKSYSELGYKDYDIYLEFKKKYHLSHNILLAYLGNKIYKKDIDMRSSNTSATFRQGKFKVGDIKKAHELCQQLLDMKQYYDRGDSRSFALAFKIAASHPNYDHNRMMSKMQTQYKLIKDSPYAEDYMRQLERIYNFHCGINRVKLF